MVCPFSESKGKQEADNYVKRNSTDFITGAFESIV